MISNLVFDVENLRGLSLGDANAAFYDWAYKLPERRLGRWGKPLHQVTLHDLAVFNRGMPSNGIYIFYRVDGAMPHVVYVGKCTSRSFLERIPSHLESREECWFNTLTNRALKWNDSMESRESASDFCLGNLAVAMIPIDCGDRDREKTSRVGLLERRLRDPKALNPLWNSCNTKVAGRHTAIEDPLIDDLLQPPPREPAKPATIG
jgi:hypothetical protein